MSLINVTFMRAEQSVIRKCHVLHQDSMRYAHPSHTLRWLALMPGTARRPRPVASARVHGRRDFALSTITAVLTPPAVFGGLLITLWTYKCIMMVVFQNKIIYM
jgi:hypothetical protein